MLPILRRLSRLGTSTAPARPASPLAAAPIIIHVPRLDGPGEDVPVVIRHSPRARHLAVKLSPSADTVTLVVPKGVSMAKAMAFLQSRHGWIVEHWQALPPRIAFAAGAIIPVLGQDRLVMASGSARGTPPFRLAPDRIEIGGEPDHLPRRLRAGLAATIRPLLAQKAGRLAGDVDRRIARISIGDPGQRWGSCNSRGNLRFSWRLILAPEPVLDYVVAHEVAHLVEMNHGPRFWRVVEKLAPGYDTQRAWLRQNGTRLMRYG